ncbi:MAG: hypothetical protein WAL22_04535 [Solirubrobacteraceae bacterium]
MPKPSTIQRTRRAAIDKRHYGWRVRATRALVAASTVSAIVGIGVFAVPGSQAATTKQGTPKAAAAAVDCSTNVYNKGIPGVVINDTNVALKRTFVEHGPSTGFFKPEPATAVAAKSVSNPWCVGSKFGVEAMKVEYELPNHEKMYFETYYATFFGGLQASCSSTAAPGSRASYGCGADKVTPNFRCSPYVGCVGPLHNESALNGVDVVFTVFPR